MSKIENKWAIIDAHDEKERQELFKYICKEIAQAPANEIKRQMLGVEGSSGDLSRYEVTLDDISEILKVYEVDMELKITFSSMKIKKQNLIDYHDENDGKHIESPVKKNIDQNHTDMKKQSEEIKNPDLLEGPGSYQGDVIVSKKEEEKPINIDALPSVPDFLT